jgi:hypothetical protein
MLPVPSGFTDREIGLKNVSDSTIPVIVSATGAADIDGSSFDTLSTGRVYRQYRSTGTGYIIV